MSKAGALKILSNAKYLYMALLMSQGLRFVYMLILARLLGAELYGLYTYGQSWYLMFLPLTGLGLGAMLSREVGKRNANTSQIVNLVATIRIVAVLAVAAISMLTGLIVAENSFIASLLLVFSFALIGKAMVMWANQMFQAFESTQLVFKIERVFKPCEIAISIVVAILTENILLVAVVHAFAQIAQGLVSVYLANKNLQKVSLLWHPKLMISTVVGLFPLAIAVFAGQFLFYGPIVLVKRSFSSASDLGNFSLLIQLFIVIIALFSSITSAALPALSRSASSNRNNLNLFSRIAIYVSCIFGIFLYIASSLFGEKLLVLAFGHKFILAGHYLALMMLVLIPATLTNLLNSVQISLEHNVKVLITNLLGAATLVLSLPWFVAQYGLAGAIFSLQAAFLVSASIGVIFLTRELVISIKDALVVPAMLLGIFALIYWFGVSIEQTEIAMLVGGMCSIIILWFVGLNSKERKSVKYRFSKLKF
ncbi:oligosaccharide flippase family protein [Aliiglaciecola sp. LCG003]|uniref:oligosaccharide flippase family protein n=1 Tax=Aliiglaciecola sp. LCG003 TaxID=3053655 RepID=UPI00257344D4|nr:oligosaccharide flippase family protein [Aliiglaciecola sp. LCG003]WJG10460.1 oligosaccharide flippase family protein [Aliiglaciecola sp. LCG003]